MKRLLALIMTFFFALNNNVSFQASDNSVYAPDNYYRIEGNESPDYRYIYENYTELQASGKCIGTSVNIAQSATDVHLTEYSSHLYWWDTTCEEEITEGYLNSLGNTYTFESRANIVAPRDCKVLTTVDDGGGHLLDLVTTDGKYEIHIANMERLFCDRKRTLADDEDPLKANWNHTVSIKGYVVKKGCMLGISAEGTTVTVKAVDKTNDSTMTGFYKQ